MRSEADKRNFTIEQVRDMVRETFTYPANRMEDNAYYRASFQTDPQTYRRHRQTEVMARAGAAARDKQRNESIAMLGSPNTPLSAFEVDSLDFMGSINAVERHFGIAIEPNGIDSSTTIGELTDIVEMQLANEGRLVQNVGRPIYPAALKALKSQSNKPKNR